MTEKFTISQAFDGFLSLIQSSRSQNTHRSYASALSFFLQSLGDPQEVGRQPISTLRESSILKCIDRLHHLAPATEHLYLTAIYRFFEYLSASEIISVNLSKLRLLIRQRTRRPGQRLPQFAQKEIEEIVTYAIKLVDNLPRRYRDRLRVLRDRALILTLADTGLRIHEACSLRRGDVDWMEHKAIVLGKGNQQAVIRFSTRSLKAIKEYLAERSPLDGALGRPIASLPLFARHDRRVGKEIKPISTTTGRQIIEHHVALALGREAAQLITPHSFRHYFVTTVLRGSGGNLKLAQELARHKSIGVTQRYAHLSDEELDRHYHEIFEQS
ncbi:MAG: tyrosine-type recombinase/integrase [Anaerolineales bacterium]|nr:tyrosine-type recombinase/integrase [Anaerolineales bacterium]MCS7247084.1 tyrosine-type recombinase/integrase [Anaerolineales bacterium]MDW8160895.1 tyrosine-type recombinase/integrase [Anaerolineales bacterium]MDW8446877.1 tyrosine-type recombinase/integrase [Anaerolineales bacterium]